MTIRAEEAHVQFAENPENVACHWPPTTETVCAGGKGALAQLAVTMTAVQSFAVPETTAEETGCPRVPYAMTEVT